MERVRRHEEDRIYQNEKRRQTRTEWPSAPPMAHRPWSLSRLFSSILFREVLSCLGLIDLHRCLIFATLWCFHSYPSFLRTRTHHFSSPLSFFSSFFPHWNWTIVVLLCVNTPQPLRVLAFLRAVALFQPTAHLSWPLKFLQCKEISPVPSSKLRRVQR